MKTSKKLLTSLLLLSLSSSLCANEFSNNLELSEYQLSGISHLMDEGTYNDVIKAGTRHKAKANILTVDTRDFESCNNVRQNLSRIYPSNNYDELCTYDARAPYNSVLFIQENKYETKRYLEGLGPELPERYNNLKKETKNVVGLGVMTIGLLYMLPESFTNWNKEELKLKNLGNNWKENVKNGPVVDKDDWVINYLGHPLSGATYHIIARNAGLSKWESFGYSVFMSTVFWEYGLEALAEKPSVQDLILTPTLGSILGELFYEASKKVDENNGELFGSKKMGKVLKVVADPSKGMRNWINQKVFERPLIKKSRTFFYTKTTPYHTNVGDAEINTGADYSEFGIGVEFKFN